MAATETQIATLRRMVAEPTTTTYTDALIQAFIEARPVPDARGVNPVAWDYSTTPPTPGENTNWIPTYDLNAAAADIWDEKASGVAQDFTFEADGASYSREQVYAQYTKHASRYRSRSYPSGIKLIRTQREVTPEGYTVETTPIIDRYELDEALNA